MQPAATTNERAEQNKESEITTVSSLDVRVARDVVGRGGLRPDGTRRDEGPRRGGAPRKRVSGERAADGCDEVFALAAAAGGMEYLELLDPVHWVRAM